MAEEKVRYSDEELQEFKQIILEKLEQAQANYDLLKGNIMVDESDPTFKVMEEGANTLSKEEASQRAQRQLEFINKLQAALRRIENGTYGICLIHTEFLPARPGQGHNRPKDHGTKKSYNFRFHNLKTELIKYLDRIIMNIKDIICPFCHCKFQFDISEFDNDNFGLNLNENEININFNDNNNNNILNINFDSKFENNENEQKIISSNSIYNIKKFHFSKINKKDSTSNNNINKEEIKNVFNNNKHQKNIGRKCKRNKSMIPKDNNIISDNNKDKVHDKYTNDNLIKKIKNLILKNLLDFINNKIYNSNIGHRNSEKKLFSLQAQKTNTYSLYFKFMNKNLKDIFSQEISEKCSNHRKDHNKNIIDSLINDKDEIKKNYFTKLFSLTFSDCLKNFRGVKDIKELEGFKDFSSIKEQLLIENGEEYVNCLEEKMKNLEELICKKVKKDGKDFQEAFNE